MNIAFFGSPLTACDILKNLHKKLPVSLVVTQPDRPVGRKQQLTPTPVNRYATKNSLPVVTSTAMSEIGQILHDKGIDLAVVAAYGQILPNTLLAIPRFGFINIHYSLLPRYRGASPVQEALLHGDSQTGITIMKMDEKLDHGEIIAQKKIAIEAHDTTESLMEKLTQSASPLLLNTIRYTAKHQSLPASLKQDHKKATYCKKITKQEAFVSFGVLKKLLNNPFPKDNRQQAELHNKIRAYYPWPVVWTILPNGKRCKLISSKFDGDTIVITKIQIEGKKSTTDSKLIDITFRNI